jgi:hypothetical protein
MGLAPLSNIHTGANLMVRLGWLSQIPLEQNLILIVLLIGQYCVVRHALKTCSALLYICNI